MAIDRISGICNVSLGSPQERARLQGVVTVEGLNTMFEMVVGPEEVLGYKASPVSPKFTVEVASITGNDWRAWLSARGRDEDKITVTTGTGDVYCLNCAVFVGNPALDVVENKITLEFQGQSVTRPGGSTGRIAPVGVLT